MRWMVAHLQARKDASGNVRPDKEHSGDHIDGVTATLMALARALSADRDEGSVYDTSGIVMI
jgi:phage terminase large subunit-like protein